MEATIVDLRYNMKSILKALDHNERVTISYRGKPKGIIMPTKEINVKKTMEHAFFGMNASSQDSVKDVMDQLRGNRYAV